MSSQSRSAREEQRADLDERLRQSGHSGADAEGLFEARVAGVSGSDVILELGPREQGVVPLDEFEEPPETGTMLRLSLRGREDNLWGMSMREARKLAAWRDMEEGSLVKALVTGVNKGGLELKIGSIAAFMPLSQVDVVPIEDPERYGGETLVCEVLEIDRAKKRVVVSRRKVLDEERRQQREDSLDRIAVGAIVRGKVSRLESYGAFVEIAPGIEGLLHVSNLAHRRIEHPEELLKAGQEIEVQILDIQEGGKRIGLGRKQLEEDPWDSAGTRFREDETYEGIVRRLADFGAFVELQPGVEGLVHVSQACQHRIRHVREVLNVGEKTPVRVLSIDPSARRISLSRLDPRGAMLGSDEALQAGDLGDIVEKGGGSSIGTNLGALFKKALDKDAE